MKTAFLFAGQGSQKPGMGKDLYHEFPDFADILNRADELLDFDLRSMMFEDPDGVLNETQYTQPALAAFAAGVTAVLERQGIRPDYTAGLSLGEYSALHEAGVFSTEELIRVTAFRGSAMARAGRGLHTRMCAVIGAKNDLIEAVCQEIREETGAVVEVSNYNAKGQTVISGEEAAVKEAEKRLMEAGAKRCMPLKVSSAFHTSLMKPAADELEEYFKKISFGPMQIPVVFNTLGRTAAENPEDVTKEQISELLKEQVMSSVRMAQSIEFLAEKGVTRIVEIGPGRVLSGFVRRTVSGVETVAIDTAEDLKNLINSFQNE